MAETGPALFVILIIIFFPMLDLIGLTWSYGICWYLNYTISNEISRSRRSEAPQIIAGAVDTISGTGFAKFLGIGPNSINVPQPVYDDEAQPPTVVVVTMVRAKPFVTVPWWGPIPGLNAPIVFVVTSRLTRELPM